MFDPISKVLSQRGRGTEDNKIRGVVIDNKDPDKRGRVKIRLRDLHDEIPDEDLPWSLPQGGFEAGSKGTGKVKIPRKNASVFVTFQDNSLYHPQYSDGPSTDDRPDDEMKENYPNRVVKKDHAGNATIHDYNEDEESSGSSSSNNSSSGNKTASSSSEGGDKQEKNEITKAHASGTTTKINTDGSVDITTAKAITINVNGPASIVASGKCTISSKEEIDIRAPKVNINKGGPSTPTEAKKRDKPSAKSEQGKTKY
jgi:Type VI secretion system/phage-baseplate injector OB domain